MNRILKTVLTVVAIGVAVYAFVLMSQIFYRLATCPVGLSFGDCLEYANPSTPAQAPNLGGPE